MTKTTKTGSSAEITPCESDYPTERSSLTQQTWRVKRRRSPSWANYNAWRSHWKSLFVALNGRILLRLWIIPRDWHGCKCCLSTRKAHSRCNSTSSTVCLRQISLTSCLSKFSSKTMNLMNARSKEEEIMGRSNQKILLDTSLNSQRNHKVLLSCPNISSSMWFTSSLKSTCQLRV